jgi:hypothetical protein
MFNPLEKVSELIPNSDSEHNKNGDQVSNEGSRVGGSSLNNFLVESNFVGVSSNEEGQTSDGEVRSNQSSGNNNNPNSIEEG